MLYPEVLSSVEKALRLPIDNSRMEILELLIAYCQKRLDNKQVINFNFICTHNSRRSQLSQVWAQVAGGYYDLPINSFSGGVEVTAFNERAVSALKRQGFRITSSASDNPLYETHFGESTTPILSFSKLYDHPDNPTSEFAAIMTCSDADENCPFIPGAEARIPLRYEDPKAFDHTNREAEMYDARSMQIASELLFVFRKVSQS